MSYFNNLPGPPDDKGRAQDWHFNLPFCNLAGRVTLNEEVSHTPSRHRPQTLDSWKRELTRLKRGQQQK